MPQEQKTPADVMAGNVKDAFGAGAQQLKDVFGASAQQVKESSQAGVDASRAVMDVYKEAASIFRDRGDGAFRTAMAVMEAGMDASLEQLNRMSEATNLQDVIRMQMMWGPNQTLAICRALSKATGSSGAAGQRPSKAANA